MKSGCDVYRLMYKNSVVLNFDINKKSIEVVNRELLPVSMINGRFSFSALNKFLSNRMMLMNRKYCKEIMISCGIEDQSDINICIQTRALSFTDCYWVKSIYSTETWEEVNLFSNEFSISVASTALCGELYDWDRIYTGELMTKGTRAKGIFRVNNEILLFKNETQVEINSECISGCIAQAFGIVSTAYWKQRMLTKECSVCRMMCDENNELISCREIMDSFNENIMNYKSKHYSVMMSFDAYNLVLMHIFDFVALNTDRNRDNFGLLRSNGRISRLFPLFDHDSCFKGKSVNGNYFPTGMSFIDTLNFIKSLPVYRLLCDNIIKARQVIFSGEFRATFLQHKSITEYNTMCERMKML